MYTGKYQCNNRTRVDISDCIPTHHTECEICTSMDNVSTGGQLVEVITYHTPVCQAMVLQE